jgi:MFS family permease
MKQNHSGRGESVGNIFRALRSRNYRLFFTGQLISLVGTWLARLAMSWLVYRLTGSKLLLGVVAFVGQIPTFLLAPFIGVLVDRWQLRRTLVVTQTLAMLQAFAIAGLTLAGVVTVNHILVLAVFLGLINAIDMPARQSFVVHMVERREDLSNAIALNSSMVNAARLLGPSIAGILIATVGEGYCFLLNGISFIPVVAAFMAMRVAPQVKRQPKQMLSELEEGFTYIRGSIAIRSILLLMALVSLVGVPYMVLMPVFARDILKGGPRTLGFLMAAAGGGALAGGLTLASRRSVIGLGRWLVRASSAFGIALIIFSFSRHLWVSLAVLPFAGYSMIVQPASSNTLLQTIVEDSKRGRVMSFFSMAFQGMMPIGSLLAGRMAETSLGAPGTVAIGGFCCIAGSIMFRRQLPLIREQLRPLFIEKGLLMETTAFEPATDLPLPPERQ